VPVQQVEPPAPSISLFLRARAVVEKGREHLHISAADVFVV